MSDYTLPCIVGCNIVGRFRNKYNYSSLLRCMPRCSIISSLNCERQLTVLEYLLHSKALIDSFLSIGHFVSKQKHIDDIRMLPC